MGRVKSDPSGKGVDRAAQRRRDRIRVGYPSRDPIKGGRPVATDAHLARRAEASRQIGEIIDRQRTADA